MSSLETSKQNAEVQKMFKEYLMVCKVRISDIFLLFARFFVMYENCIYCEKTRFREI